MVSALLQILYMYMHVYAPLVHACMQTRTCVHVNIHVYTCACFSVNVFSRTLLKQGPYGRKQVARRVIIITPGSLVKVSVSLSQFSLS